RDDDPGPRSERHMDSDRPLPPAVGATSPANAAPAPPAAPVDAPPAAESRFTDSVRRYRWLILGVVLLGILLKVVPIAATAWRSVSTTDAYVNGHVTFVAPRVAGQVLRVLVDDNNRVRKGELVMQLDPEPFQVRVNIAHAS